MLFTKTRIEIADFHTTLSYFTGRQPGAGVLPMGNPSSYNNFYQQAADNLGGIEYQVASGGKTGNILLRFRPFFLKDKYWHRYLETRQYAIYADLAWDYQVPLSATLVPRVEYITDPQLPGKVSPLLKVLLFPFGWSTWLSLLISGDHDLISLSSLIQRVCNDRIFQLSGDTAPRYLQQMFDAVSEGTMMDAFAGPATMERSSPDLFITVTVLEKLGGSLASGGLSSSERLALQRIVRPTGPLGSATFQEQIKGLRTDPRDPLLNFTCVDKFGRFVWFYNLLTGQARDKKHLECYHNNLFRAFLLAYHQISLLESVLQQRGKLNPELSGLVEKAMYLLENPTYQNISLELLLESEQVQRTLSAARRRWPLPADN